MQTTRRRWLAALGATATAGCLGGPSGGTDDTPTDGPPSPSVDDATLLLNWKPSGLHVPYYVADAEGFYEDQGLPLSTIEVGQGSDFSAKQAGLGNVAFSVTSSDQVLNINSRDVSVRSVATVMQRSPVVVFSTEETFGERLKEPDQLAGKTVGTGPGMVRILTRLLLERTGVADDVELVDTGYDTVQKLLADDVDAAGGVFGDAISTRAQGYEVDTIPVAEEVPSYGHVLATAPSFAEENPDAVRAFLRATARGSVFARRNPETAIDHLVAANESLGETRDQQREKWETLATEFMMSSAVSEHGWGWSETSPWETVAAALDDADVLEGDVDADAVWTNDHLDTDYRYIGSYTDVVGE